MVLVGILLSSVSVYLVINSLNDAGVGEGKIPLSPHGNDEMFMNLNADDVGGFYEPGGDGFVFTGRRDVLAWMVMTQNDRRSTGQDRWL